MTYIIAYLGMSFIIGLWSMDRIRDNEKSITVGGFVAVVLSMIFWWLAGFILLSDSSLFQKKIKFLNKEV